MNNDSRTINTVRNMGFGVVSQIIMVVLNFINRTIFIHVLGEQYLGVNGLFTNILTVLSFVELGIGNAIIYGLYKPLAEKNEKAIAQHVQFLGKCYRIVGVSIGFLGLMVIPFLGVIIKNPPAISEDLTLIYLLFLTETVMSYFFGYKQSVINADQKNYITTTYRQVFYFMSIVAKILILIFTGNFILYLVAQIVFPLLGNICATIKAEKMYPFINDKVEPMDKSEVKVLFKNIKALALYRFSDIALNSMANIILSAFVGIVAVGLASNYLLIISAIVLLLDQVVNAFTASVGNLNAIGDGEKKKNIFNELFFFSVWVYGFVAVMLLLFANDLIVLWIGKDYLIGLAVVAVLVLDFYVKGVQNSTYMFRTTMGLFVQGKYAPLLATILNIALAIILAKPLGMFGVFLATPICRLLTFGIVDPYLIYKYGLKDNPFKYYFKFAFYLVILIIFYFILKYLISFIALSGLFGFIIKCIIGAILFNILFVLVFFKTREFQGIKKVVLYLLDVVKNKIKK